MEPTTDIEYTEEQRRLDAYELAHGYPDPAIEQAELEEWAAALPIPSDDEDFEYFSDQDDDGVMSDQFNTDDEAEPRQRVVLEPRAIWFRRTWSKNEYRFPGDPSMRPGQYVFAV